VRSIVFDGECHEHEITPPTAGLLPCSQARVPAFKIYTPGDQPAIYATGFQLQDKLVRIALPNNQGSLAGAQQNVSALARVQACPTEFAPPAAHPSSFCFEPVQFAVNWSLDPAMPNTVFTRGFAVFVQTLPEHTTAQALDIRGALGTALTVWTSGLLKYKDKLGPTVASYLQTTVSRSSSFVLLTPPQVIQVVCKENASLIVRVSAARGGDFPKADSDYLAKSQIEGRTVLLNEADHKFEYTLTRKVDPGDYDLIWVLAHELGHSFGLPDEYLGPDHPSIMNPDTRPLEITEEPSRSVHPSNNRSGGQRPDTLMPLSVEGSRFRARDREHRRRKRSSRSRCQLYTALLILSNRFPAGLAGASIAAYHRHRTRRTSKHSSRSH
jgi:hypothetical protein